MKPMNTITLLAIASTLVLLVFVFSTFANAESLPIDFDWTVSYSLRAPLGVSKLVILINDQFPGPVLNATTNDVVHINIHNNITDPFLMTWNGLQLRRNSWQEGVQETNCPILPGQNWTYSFQLKDQIGSFFYFPSLFLQKAAGGYGAIRVNNRDVVSVPFTRPLQEFDVLVGDWYNSDHRDMRAALDVGNALPLPDGILINGLGPNQAIFDFEPGATYRLRISNVGLKTTLNLRIQDHLLLLVETEGSYTLQQSYSSLDIHVGQSYSVLVTAKNQTNGVPYYMVASSRFTPFELFGIGIIRYPDSKTDPFGPLPSGPLPFDYMFSLEQARSIRWDLAAGASRPNPQGSFHYGSINISRTLFIQNGLMYDLGMKLRYTLNGLSFVQPDTPLKLTDYFQLPFDTTSVDISPDSPFLTFPALGTSVINVNYHDFVHIVFYNPLSYLQSHHIVGYNFFVVGMDRGPWDESKMATYNMVDAVSRSTVQVYPFSWTAILIKFDNQGMWNLRSQDAERWYLGQELYLIVKGLGEEDPPTIPEADEAPIPANVIKCGRAANI